MIYLSSLGDPSTQFEICWDSHSSYSKLVIQCKGSGIATSPTFAGLKIFETGFRNCNKPNFYWVEDLWDGAIDRQTEFCFESLFRHALPSTQLVAVQDEMKSSTRLGTTTDCWQKKTQSCNHVGVGALGLEQRRRASTPGGYLSISLPFNRSHAFLKGLGFLFSRFQFHHHHGVVCFGFRMV